MMQHSEVTLDRPVLVVFVEILETIFRAFLKTLVYAVSAAG